VFESDQSTNGNCCLIATFLLCLVMHTAVDLEDPALIGVLYQLFHGTLENESVPADERCAPASPGMRARILGLFCKSIAAANHFPATMQVSWASAPLNCTFESGAPLS
jgi:hypothetical protein